MENRFIHIVNCVVAFFVDTCEKLDKVFQKIKSKFADMDCRPGNWDGLK